MDVCDETEFYYTDEDSGEQSNQRHIPITYNQAYAILEDMKRKHDACVGINWDVIDCYLNHINV